LLDLCSEVDEEYLFATLEPGAERLVFENPYAFSLATCRDQGSKAT